MLGSYGAVLIYIHYDVLIRATGGRCRTGRKYILNVRRSKTFNVLPLKYLYEYDDCKKVTDKYTERVHVGGGDQ